MKNRGFLLGLLIIGALLSGVALHANAQSSDEKAIKTLTQRFNAAVKAKDINKIMSVYIPDESLFVFDVVPLRQYVGAKAYRKDFEEFFGLFPGPVEYAISDLSITDGGHSGLLAPDRQYGADRQGQ
jgi:ketosteroid isomerase-like protein